VPCYPPHDILPLRPNSTRPAAALATASVAFLPEAYPNLYVIKGHIADKDFPKFYKAGNAFVLPSRCVRGRGGEAGVGAWRLSCCTAQCE
jgi:hypothetical protein